MGFNARGRVFENGINDEKFGQKSFFTVFGIKKARVFHRPAKFHGSIRVSLLCFRYFFFAFFVFFRFFTLFVPVCNSSATWIASVTLLEKSSSFKISKSHTDSFPWV